MRNRLLQNLYPALDQNPDAVTAFALTYPGGCTWSIADQRLSVRTEAGLLLTDISLLTGTVADVVRALGLAGVTVENSNAELQALHAGVLIDGAGSQSQNNGNIVLGHRSVLWALISSYAQEIEVAAGQIPQALEQAMLHSAAGDWLDFWGGNFGIERATGQTDDQYLTAILRETLRPRSNKYAIEKAILDETGSQVMIEEPWQKIFILDGSQLSGDARLKDGVTVGRNLIVPVAYGAADWGKVLPVIERNRAAGVLVLAPQNIVFATYGATYQTQPWCALTWDTPETWGSIKFIVGFAHTSSGS